MKLTNHVSLTPLIQALSALVTAGTLIMASRGQQFVDVAGYTAAVSVTAIVSVVVGGGSTISFALGSDELRNQIRALRWRLIAPTSLVISLIALALFSPTAADLPAVSLISGCLATVALNLSSIEHSTLQRHNLFFLWGAITISSRIVSLVLVSVGLRFSVSTALGFAAALAASTFAASRVTTTPRPTRRKTALFKTLFQRDASAIVLIDALMTRSPLLIAPVALSAWAAGQFSTLVLAHQSVTALVTMTLFAIMNRRSAMVDNVRGTAHRRTEQIILIGTVPASILAMLLSGPLLGLLAITRGGLAHLTFISLAFVTPVLVFNRATQYRLMSGGRQTTAAFLIGVIGLTVVLLCAVTLFSSSYALIALIIPLGELAGLVASLRVARSVWAYRAAVEETT